MTADANIPVPTARKPKSEQLPWNPPAGSLPVPCGEVSLNDSADKIFAKAAKTERLFIKDKLVVELVQRNGVKELEPMTPVRFRSFAEELGPLIIYKRFRDGWQWHPALLCEENSEALLQTDSARQKLPPVSTVLNCPVLVSDCETPRVLPPGYHPYFNGILIIGGTMPPEIGLDEAISKIEYLLSQFLFVTGSDRARAIASLLIPGLMMGNLVPGRAPIEVAEANASGAGKGYRQKIIAAIYNDKCRDVAKKRGVGSIEESVGAALISGRMFIRLDNVRGLIDSQWIESFADSDDIPARIPYLPEVRINPSRHLLYITSNGLHATPDLAQRALIIRTIAQHPLSYRTYPEGELLEHVRANQAEYLGCIYSVLKKWINEGRLMSREVPHRYQSLLGVCDWIVTTIFGTPPLMEDHEAIQKRASDFALTTTRELCVAAHEAGRDNDDLFAADLADLAQERGIKIPGVKADATPEHAYKQVGTMLGKLFTNGGSNEIEIDGYVIKRKEVTRQSEESGTTFKSKAYSISPLEKPTQ